MSSPRVPEQPVPVSAPADRGARPSAEPAADGAPVLLLGNSLGTSAAVWAGQAGEFARQFRVLSYELPGHGGTPAAPGEYSVAGLGAGVLALADSLGVGRFAYCGISLGGMIGMWLAASAPERVTALGLVCTSAFLPPAEGWHDRAAKVRAGGMAAVSEAVIARWFTPAFAAASPAAVAACQAGLERTNPAGYAGCCEAIAAMDLRADLAAITAPTLVLAGSDDPATPPEHGAAIAAAISGARLEVLSGVAHLGTVQAPGAVTSALLAHLRAAGVAGAAAGS